jgi:hypothetical protein
MSTLANITSLNLSLQTGGAALAVKAAGRLVAPARTVLVYGTADDVAPNFTTVAGALTYANSLAPLAEEPVVIRLFTKTDGAPYTFADIAEPLDWDEYANAGFFFVSDYVRLNKTTSIPSSLPVGLQVWYIDANGVETLWVGREDGSAWPAVGYKEYVAVLNQLGTNAPVATVKIDTIGLAGAVFARTQDGLYTITDSKLSEIDNLRYIINTNTAIDDVDAFVFIIQTPSVNRVDILSYIGGANTDGALSNTPFSIKIYP